MANNTNTWTLFLVIWLVVVRFLTTAASRVSFDVDPTLSSLIQGRQRVDASSTTRTHTAG